MESTTQGKLEVVLAALHACEQRAVAGMFALEVMHEVRNPLDALQNLLFLAAHERELEVIQGYIRDAQEQIVNLTHIAGQSLDLARVAETQLPKDLITLAGIAIKVHRGRIAAKHVKIVSYFDPPDIRVGEVGWYKCSPT